MLECNNWRQPRSIASALYSDAMRHVRQAGPRAPRFGIFLLDILIVTFVVAGVIAFRSGPYRESILGLRLSVSSPWRPWSIALGLLLLRTWLDPIVPAIGRLATGTVRLLKRAWAALGQLARAVRRMPQGEARLFAFEPGRTVAARLVELGAVLTGFTALTTAFTWPQAVNMYGVPDMGDPLFSIWRIAWVNHRIWRAPAALFDANIFHPESLTLTYSDPVLVPALMSAPLFWLGLHKVVIYNLLFLSAFVLSGVTTYYLLRALTGRRDAAIVGSVIFALHPYRLEHYSHLELQMTMWMPLALWGLHRALAGGRIGDGFLTGVAFALQMLSSLYYGMYFAVYLVIVGGTIWIGRRFPRRPLVMLAAGALVAGVLIAPVAAKYLANKPMMGDRDPRTVNFYSAKIEDYLKPHFRSYPYEPWSHGGMAERQLFPHVAPVVLALAGMSPPLSVAQVGYTIALAASVEASLGMNGYTFPMLRAVVPGYAGLRVPARFSILAGLSLAILGGYGAARLFARWPGARTWLALAMLGAIMVESLPNIDLEQVWREPPAIYDALATQPDAVVAEMPVPSRTGLAWSDTRYEYFSTFYWYRMVNGNSGFAPPSYLELLAQEEEFPDDNSLAYLRKRGVNYVAWHGAFTNPVRYANTAAILEARSDIELVAVAPWEGSESRLYRLK
jgi:hypothetical protein